jgi:hypothetical protein
MIIEVAYCEDCGNDSPWRAAPEANNGSPGCRSVGVLAGEQVRTNLETKRTRKV